MHNQFYVSLTEIHSRILPIISFYKGFFLWKNPHFGCRFFTIDNLSNTINIHFSYLRSLCILEMVQEYTMNVDN